MYIIWRDSEKQLQNDDYLALENYAYLKPFSAMLIDKKCVTESYSISYITG